jgi:hypothetical protein
MVLFTVRPPAMAATAHAASTSQRWRSEKETIVLTAAA